MRLKKYVAVLAFGIIAFAGCTRDNKFNNSNKLTIYPNPFIDKFYVNVNVDQPIDFRLKVYNVNGALIKDINIVNNGQLLNNILVDATGEKDGIMYLVAELPNGNLSQKILKVKP